jgi:hypothetical protein
VPAVRPIDCLARDRLLLEQLLLRLDVEARLVGGERAAERCAAVHLLEHSRRGERVEVAADRHLRDVEQAGELAHPDRSLPPQLLHDQPVALHCEHVLSIIHLNEHAASSRCHILLSTP